jgi:pantetheine-phosphate adenylyltransferase
MKIAICPGSFDPVTYGHLNIIERSAALVDKLIVAVFRNPNKHSMFTMEERLDMLKETTKHLPNVEVDAFDGLLNEYAEAKNCHLLVRGLRAFSDFEYEFQRALLLKKVNPKLETAFFMTDGQYSFLSSTGVRELACFGGNVSELVPPYVQHVIEAKFKSDKSEA